MLCALGPATHTGWIDLDRGVFHRRAPGERETNKRKPPVKLARGSSPTCAAGTRTASATPSSGNGEPIGTGLEKAFRRACQDAGLEGVTPHTLRHTAATWLMRNGTRTWEAARSSSA
jgi:integrase